MKHERGMHGECMNDVNGLRINFHPPNLQMEMTRMTTTTTKASTRVRSKSRWETSETPAKRKSWMRRCGGMMNRRRTTITPR